MNECDDNNKKILQVLFRSGSIDENDEWLLCEKCCELPEFKKCRIKEEKLN